ncbi:hypothetical protein LTR28_003810 [Elasticomyces elasticus]|nr:hypothetical protein LTR28_003810 [Elasticomyces elasticus]
MKITAVGLALLFTTGVVFGLPRPVSREDPDSCYYIDYEHDDNSNIYGGYASSYDVCTASFDTWYPKPSYSEDDSCFMVEYRKDNCNYDYGGHTAAMGTD